jgi:hypothetical protein
MNVLCDHATECPVPDADCEHKVAHDPVRFFVCLGAPSCDQGLTFCDNAHEHGAHFDVRCRPMKQEGAANG